MFTRIFILSVIILTSACSTSSIKSVNDFSPKNMQKSNVMPSESELENRPFKVVVFDFDDGANKLAKRSQVGKSLASELVAQIGKANTVYIDQSGLSGLKDVMKNKTDASYDHKVADFAVIGSINVATHSKKYNKAKVYKNKDANSYPKKDVKTKVEKPTCTHSALVQGSVNVYEVKSKNLIKTVSLSGGSYRTTDINRRYSRSCNTLSKAEISAMLRSAASKAVKREDVVLQNLFRANGYVLERRSNGKSSIFKVSIGQKNGLEQGLKAEFFASDNSKHPLTGAIYKEQHKVTEGTVTNKIQDTNAWVIIDNEEHASQVRLGDMVKVSYEKSFLGKIFNRSYSQ